MLNIANYTTNVTLILTEAGKYFALLVFCVLAIRLWRRWGKSSVAKKNMAGFICALIATLLALAIGYFSMRQSLGLMYSHYGMQAFHGGRLQQALSLFTTADGNWHTADTTGQKGVCIMLLGSPVNGRNLIVQARAMRKGDSQFEDFYEGVYLFTTGDSGQAIPLLEFAGGDDDYRWNVIKIFAVINLEAGRLADVNRLMQPFMHAEVTEFDQAYILAALKLTEGKKSEARTLLDKFPMSELSPMWQIRYKKLRAQLDD
jgi:hypothetical protein